MRRTKIPGLGRNRNEKFVVFQRGQVILSLERQPYRSDDAQWVHTLEFHGKICRDGVGEPLNLGGLETNSSSKSTILSTRDGNTRHKAKVNIKQQKTKRESGIRRSLYGGYLTGNRRLKPSKNFLRQQLANYQRLKWRK